MNLSVSEWFMALHALPRWRLVAVGWGSMYSSNEVRSRQFVKHQWQWYVYVLECKDGFYYTGMTWDIAQRMEQHYSGKGSKFTARHGVKSLCYVEAFADLEEARLRERQLKDFSRKKKEALWNNDRWNGYLG